VASEHREPPPPSSSLDALWLRDVGDVTSWVTAAPAGPVKAVPVVTSPVVSVPDLPPTRPPDTRAAPERDAPTPPPTLGRRRRGRRWLIEWAVVLVVAVGVAVGIRTFAVQTFYIPSASMQPTLMIGDRILVDKLSYHLHGVHRGDIVVFGKPPGEDAGPEVKDLVKRVIGLPGDTVSSVAGHVDINGKLLPEPWLVKGTVTTGIQEQTIPPGKYWVMGDNRSDSQDSRFFGPIPKSLIVGRVVMKIWPVTALHFY
jgi:signal peptidase I